MAAWAKTARFYLKNNKKQKRATHMAKIVTGKCKTLGSNPNTTK
jgi:hypothetical protein